MKEIKKSRLADISVVSEAGSGLHFLLKVQTDMSDKEYVEICSGFKAIIFSTSFFTSSKLSFGRPNIKSTLILLKPYFSC